MSDHPERRESLWWLALAPSIWVAHLLASYISAAVYCAKGSGQSFDAVRWAILGYTIAALAGIAATGIHGLRRHRGNESRVPAGSDTREARHGFLALATIMLSALSAVGVSYVALPAAFMETCR